MRPREGTSAGARLPAPRGAPLPVCAPPWRRLSRCERRESLKGSSRGRRVTGGAPVPPAPSPLSPGSWSLSTWEGLHACGSLLLPSGCAHVATGPARAAGGGDHGVRHRTPGCVLHRRLLTCSSSSFLEPPERRAAAGQEPTSWTVGGVAGPRSELWSPDPPSGARLQADAPPTTRGLSSPQSPPWWPGSRAVPVHPFLDGPWVGRPWTGHQGTDFACESGSGGCSAVIN